MYRVLTVGFESLSSESVSYVQAVPLDAGTDHYVTVSILSLQRGFPIGAVPRKGSWILGFSIFRKMLIWGFSDGIWGLGGCANDRCLLWDSNTRILTPNRSIWVHFR